MQCERCHQNIIEGQQHQHLGRVLCEDCYMDVLSPAKTCDPWAVHSAKTFEKEHGGRVTLTETQQQILEVLKASGTIRPEDLAARLKIRPSDLERELAALRHMEKTRGELRNGQRYVTLW